MKRIVFKNVSNMRDLGGYLTKDKKVTKYLRFIRSDAPVELEKEEIDFLLENNITTIIDFRKDYEVEKNKCMLNTKGFNYYNISLEGSEIPKTEDDIPRGYMNMINHKNSMSKIFTVMASAKSNILFHCMAGKDRTGVVAMILLLLANAYEEDIIADYEVSNTYLKNKIKKMHEDNPALPSFLGSSKSKHMEEALQLFKEEYGSVNKYMEFLGIDLDMVNTIKSKLID